MTGGVLATTVNFFNPDRLVLGGVHADSSVFVAGVRSTLFADSLPVATEQLSIDVTSDQLTGGLRGAARMFLDRVFSVDGWGRLLRRNGLGPTRSRQHHLRCVWQSPLSHEPPYGRV
jgi:hypothetical protein